MPALVGVLLDFSKSMKEIFYDTFDKNDGQQSASILKVVQDLMTKENVSSENKIFVIGFGTRYGRRNIDIIGTIQQFQEIFVNPKNKFDHDHLERILDILENKGASAIRSWISEDAIRKHIHYSLLALMEVALMTSKEFCEKVVSSLPRLCRANTVWENVTGLIEQYASKEKEINDMVQEVQQYFFEDKILMQRFFKEDVVAFDFKYAADAVRNWFKGITIDDNQLWKVLQTIDIFSSVDKTVFPALEKSLEIFKNPEYAYFKKYLFVLSDGALSNSGVFETASTLKEENVKVISCYVSNSMSMHYKRLYSKEEVDWEYGARFMFKLSSTFKTGIIPNMILEETGWSIDKSTQESKLFLHLRHTYQIREMYDAVIVLLCLDGQGSTSLFKCKHDVEIYLFPEMQVRDTYYAHIVATVLHSAMKKNRNRGAVSSEEYVIRHEIINKFEVHGGDVPEILEKLCSKYRMRYKKVEMKQAIVAITSNRPIIATFSLTEHEWNTFSSFFESNPRGTLTKNELDITKRQLIKTEKVQQHGVVLTGFGSTYLKFMNSWGCSWADYGFFRVQNANVLQFELYDIFGAKMIDSSRE